jgi:hypothetical protein
MTSATNPPADARSCNAPPRPGRRLPHPGWCLLAGLVVCVALLALRFGLPAYRQARLIEAIESSGGSFHLEPPRWAENWLNLGKDSTILKGVGWLRQVGLQGASIDDAWLARLNGAGDLQTLGLIETRVTDAGMAHVGTLTQLRGLGLYDTSVGDVGLAHLRSLSDLTDVNLYNTRVTDAGLAHMGRMTRLKYLRVKDAYITDAGLARVARITSIEYLMLRGTNVTDAGLAQLAGLKSLSLLDLGETPVTDAGVPHMTAIPSLTWLVLDHTQVTDMGLRALVAGLPGLKTVYVARDQISVDCRDELERLRSNLEILVHDKDTDRSEISGQRRISTPANTNEANPEQ